MQRRHLFLGFAGIYMPQATERRVQTAMLRAPERRVFFVDVGTMPPDQAKRHLAAIMEDHRAAA